MTWSICTEGHIEIREPIVPFEHQEEPDCDKIDLSENDCSFAQVDLAVAEEILRHLSPMAILFNVMADVITVVEAASVITGVNAGDAIAVAVAGIVTVDERMLPPVAGHHGESTDD